MYTCTAPSSGSDPQQQSLTPETAVVKEIKTDQQQQQQQHG
jgi:hypothetical protein